MPQRNECELESLPPEVRRQLLSVLDLPQLKTLVRASPVFHQQYLYDRRYLASKSLEQTLGSACFDAYVVYLCETQPRDIPRLLGLYTEQATARRSAADLLGDMSYREMMGIAAFYFNSVQPLVDFYARWALNNLAKETERRPRRRASSVTSSEKLRLTRAAYRFHQLCHILDFADAAPGTSPADDICSFLGFFEGWEVEEMYSFYQFAEYVIGDIFREVQPDLRPDSPRFANQTRTPTPISSFDLQTHRQFFMEGTVLKGKLTLLNEILFMVKDRDDLVDLMQQRIAIEWSQLMNQWSGIPSETYQGRRRANNPTENDERFRDKAPCPFRGDSDGHGPPLAWTTIWNETYSNLYGCHTSDDLRRWGYVFWDAATIHAYGAKKVLEHQWYQCWQGEEPRDYLY